MSALFFFIQKQFNMINCKVIGCKVVIADDKDYCRSCSKTMGIVENREIPTLLLPPQVPKSMAETYPKYYKKVGNLKEVDVYAVHMLFDIDDPSGAIQHASKKLLLSGVRTGGKSQFDDIREARDTLNRWLELNTPVQTN